MMRGANDLRNAKVENEEQRREIAFLHDQLEVAKNEKADVLKRITAVKEAAKRTLDTSSQNLKDMEVTLKELKSQSERSFEIVAHARESLSNVQELRKTASETKAVVQELQLECSSTQQVADLLRDRLQSLGADFIDAKNRVTELEDAQVADRKALRDATSNLSSASVQVGKLTESLRKQGDQLYEALSSAADAEAKFSVSSQEIMRSRHLISEKDEELETLHSVEEENRKLLLQLDECRSSLSALAGIQDELSTANEVLHGRGSEICILQASVAARDATIMTMQEKLREAEKRWQEEHTSVLRLKGDLKTCEVREHGALMRIESLVSDKDQLSEKTRELETRLEEVRRDAGDRTEKLHQMNARCQVLEERFEEQAVTLRITKECNGDLQERLLAAEANHATNLESSAGKFTCEIAVLNEQKANLQARADDLQAQMTRKDDETRSLTAELEAKLKNQEIEYVSRCTVEQQRTTKAEDDLRKTQAHICVLEEKLSTASARVVELQQELKFTNSSSFNRQEEIDALKSHIRLLETRAEQLSQRAKTIDVRYGAGDLADVEKAFIQSLLQTSQAMHEQELIAKGNELRRRDNTIKELRAKVQLVESTLAKHVRTQVHGQPPPSGHSPHTGPQQSKIQPDAGVGHQSLIDPTYWMSSNHSSSPMTTALAVPEVGSPSKEVAAPQTRQPTETTVSRSPHQLLTGPKVTKVAGSAGKAAAKESGNLAADPCTPGKPLDVSGPATKPQFSRLATVCSDENFTLEDDPIQPTTPTAGLGKRGQMSSVANEATASRQPKRSKTSVPRKSAESKVPTLAENTGTKSRPRKKR
ncbi:hypothetical protein OBBRIDRAFT_395408 [Obba rivulosa]|uniref:Uncharacterized protein n=1 Tax=Obba rivulosa TaxID=1052685 RepID=A0A8E2DNG7_9APHY|nr:hypothetical protein OBBRIDRAFT_395408 [Obba rivulosa]